MVSAPARPFSTLLPLLPVSRLARSLPVALILPAPSSVRRSMLARAASDRVIVEVIVSVPPVSVTVSLSSPNT
ncbi:MAG: hypothetical protein FP819_25520 [Rhizobiaceae bacterium]|nr:hypothetical protein [Rhizobiaceae bacterium]